MERSCGNRKIPHIDIYIFSAPCHHNDKGELMVNPHQHIEYLNTTGADIDLKPQPLKPSDLPDQLDKTQLKAHIAKGLPSIDTARIDDLPFKIKTDEWEWKEIEGVGKFPKNYKPDFLDFD